MSEPRCKHGWITPPECPQCVSDECDALKAEVEAWNSCLEQFGIEPETVLAHVKGLQNELKVAKEALGHIAKLSGLSRASDIAREALTALDAPAGDTRRSDLAEGRRAIERLKWLHDCSVGQTDPEGYEWGIYRVKWENGRAVSVLQTNSDFSDIDAEMKRVVESEKE